MRRTRGQPIAAADDAHATPYAFVHIVEGAETLATPPRTHERAKRPVSPSIDADAREVSRRQRGLNHVACGYAARMPHAYIARCGADRRLSRPMELARDVPVSADVAAVTASARTIRTNTPG